MKLLSSTLLLLPFLFDSAFSLESITIKAPKDAPKAGSLIPDTYIVTLKEVTSSAAVSSHLKWLDGVIASSNERVAAGKKPGVLHQYDVVAFQGYSGVFPKGVMDQIKKRSEVAMVEQDSVVTTLGPVAKGEKEASSKAPCNNQPLSQPEYSGEWGLGRISHATRYSTSNIGWPFYPYDGYTGYCPSTNPGGTAYVIDSGILATHPEFSGRVTWGYTSNPSWPNTDICGHGTHVAGTIGGNIYGVQKTARLIAVKTLEGTGGYCSGTWGDVIAGINWSYTHAVINGRLKTGVINMSLGGSINISVNNALANAIAGGLSAVVAAGNDYGANSCAYSPASVPAAITVGSTNIYDMVSSFSNLGCCIDIFAPGENIGSAWVGNQYVLLSGTSMASPAVAGMVLYNKCRHGYTTPAQDTNGIMNTLYSTNGAISPFMGCTGTNKLVYNRNNCV